MKIIKFLANISYIGLIQYRWEWWMESSSMAYTQL